MTKSTQRSQMMTRASAPAVPDEVSVALTEIVSSAREGLLAFAVGTGLQVMQQIMNHQVAALCGPPGKHNPDRLGYRHGRVPIERPRVRSADRSRELTVPAYTLFAGTELLGAMALERMLAGLSTRRYQAGLEPVGVAGTSKAAATSRSAVSRKFVQATEHALAELLAAPLADLDLVALMVDGVHFAEHCCVVALGIDSTGGKHPLALEEGSTENATLVRDLLVKLRDQRGLDVSRPILVVIDGALALHSAVLDVFDQPVIQRCQLHKLRNVMDKLPERLRETVAGKMRRAYHATSALEAEAQLAALAHELERTHPGAAASLREGLAETVLALEVPPTLARTLRSTNAIESMIEICRDHSRNVKRWQDGAMVVRWCAAGMLEAKKQFRRVNGYLHLPALRAALDRHLNAAARYKGDAA